MYAAPGIPWCRLQPFSLYPSDVVGSAPLRIDFSVPRAGTLIVIPAGEADIATAPELHHALDQIAATGRLHVIVDLDQLTFRDVSVLDVLEQAHQRLKEADGDLQVRCRNPQSRRLLSIRGLDDMLTA